MEFMQKYPDDAACLESLWRTRYSPDGEHAYCPNCDTERVFKRYDTAQQRQSWTCTTCAHRLHPTAGTIYHKSSTSLYLWFYATYLMASTRCGISAKQLERELGVTYKTAWRMAYLIRNVLMEQNFEPMSGPVEVDETFVGGKVRKPYSWTAKKDYTKEQRSAAKRDSLANKTTVQGIVQHGGRVVAVTVANQKRVSLPNVQKYVLPAETVYTDELHSYRTLTQQGYKHDRVNHREGVYVSGDVYTNTIEGFWSLTKNGIRGVYHAVSAKHLQGYLNEYAWRYSHRNDELPMVETLLLRAASGD
jgi:transposase-like protein